MILFSALSGFSQDFLFQIPDYKQIEKEVNDKESDFYYPVLMRRFKAYDTTLTNSQYRRLYFGYVFQKEYSPYSPFSKEDELRKYYSGEFDSSQYPKVIELLNEALDEFPLSLDAMGLLAYVYRLSGDTAMDDRIQANVGGLMSAIMGSGDGTKCETAFHVITVSDEYFLLNMLGVQSEEQSLINGCDFLKIKGEGFKIPGLYFDVRMIMQRGLRMGK